MPVMLSVPCEWVFSSGRSPANISFMGKHKSFFFQKSLCSISSSNLLVHSSLDMQSHIPSLANIINLSSLVRFRVVISGFAVTAWASYDNLSFCLNEKSPNPRLTANSPWTRLFDTFFPAARIRAVSHGLFGTWSKLRGTRPLTCFNTALVSPALAQYISSGVTKTTQAVQPSWTPKPGICFYCSINS